MDEWKDGPKPADLRGSYLTLRRLSTDMEEAGFCGRGMIGVVASLGRGGGGGGGGGWYHRGWKRNNVAPVFGWNWTQCTFGSHYY